MASLSTYKLLQEKACNPVCWAWILQVIIVIYNAENKVQQAATNHSLKLAKKSKWKFHQKYNKEINKLLSASILKD